jgi:hypothetical protein
MPHSFGAAVSDAGLEDDFDRLARRKFPVAPLKQRVDKHTVETIELSRIKVSIDEHDVSNGDLTDLAETKIACTSLDRGRARVCLDRVKSETVPTGHRRDCRELHTTPVKFVQKVCLHDVGEESSPRQPDTHHC